MFCREFTKYTVMYGAYKRFLRRVGQNHICTRCVYKQFWPTLLVPHILSRHSPAIQSRASPNKHMGLARTVYYTIYIWPYMCFSCQKYRVYTVYTYIYRVGQNHTCIRIYSADIRFWPTIQHTMDSLQERCAYLCSFPLAHALSPAFFAITGRAISGQAAPHPHQLLHFANRVSWEASCFPFFVRCRFGHRRLVYDRNQVRTSLPFPAARSRISSPV